MDLLSKKTTRDERQEWRRHPISIAYRERLLETVLGHLDELYGVCRMSSDPAVRARMARVDELKTVVNEVLLGTDDVPDEEEGKDE